MHDDGDRQLLEAMRRRGCLTVTDCAKLSSVTPTAVRHRLQRLMARGLVSRTLRNRGRGRPLHSYSLTEEAQVLLGQNYAELAMTLWEELKKYEDRRVGMMLLKRVADRLGERYRQKMAGQTVEERMSKLRKLLTDRGVDVEVGEKGTLPVLRQHSCPYHELAAADRTVCGIEMRMFERALDSELKLSQCRLDGHGCCEFEVRMDRDGEQAIVMGGLPS